MKLRGRIEVSPGIATAGLLLLTGVWAVLFISDAGNFWHGGTAAGLVMTEAAAALGILALVEVLRSAASKLVKCVLVVVAAPLILFALFALFYAAQRALAV